MTRRAVVLAALLAAGCSQSPLDPGAFNIYFTLDRETGGCASEACRDYGMTCGAALLMRIVDLESNLVLSDRCETVRASDQLCDLARFENATTFGIPPHRIRIEAAAWRPELVTVIDEDGNERLDCPPADDVFTLDGRPREDANPMPAFAGAAVFDVGSDATDAFVPLTCADAEQLAAAECSSTERTLVSALVDDVETSLEITAEQAAGLTVSVAEPEARADGMGGTTYAIEAADTFRLPLEIGPTPSFQAFIDHSFGATVCTLVEEGGAQSTPAVSCETVSAGENPLPTHGVLLPKPTLDELLAAKGGPFPAEGLLVGRVVDHTGAPLAGVTITPSSGSVQYLSSDRASLIGTETSSSAFFVATGVPFGTAFTAIHNSDGRRELGSPRAGLVAAQLTVLIVEMQPP